MDAVEWESAPSEPRWKLSYVPVRVTGDGTVRDPDVAPAHWYLTPWEADEALASRDFTGLVDHADPRLPQPVAAHRGPAAVILTCTRCGRSGTGPSAFHDHPATCDRAPASPPTRSMPAVTPDAAPAPEPSVRTPRPASARPRDYTDPTCREAWMAAARTGTLVEGIDTGWPSRDLDALESWTVQLSFDVDAYSREHAEQIAALLEMITGGKVTGLS